MKIKILLATYNGEKYIEEQISSILSQKDVLVNIIVSDDSSKDIPPYSIAVGSPAKVIKKFDFDKNEWVRC